MADMIARLKVDSSEYDSKIQRAAKGIQHLAEACHNAGAHLNVLEDENREYIQSLGNMATVATTARGKIAELTSAFIDIKSVYNSLSQEEKNGEFGKELNKQLDIMKGRIQEGKRELADINNEINGGGGLTGALDAVAGKFGLNIGELTKFGGAMAAVTTALKVGKDAFFASESSVDEWGRTVAASESVYEGFLNAINNGDISGFLSNIDEIVAAARKAYDELDRLGTMKTIQSPQMDRQNAENVRLRMMLMTGKYIAPAAGSGLKATKAEGTLLTPAEIKTLERQLQNGMQNIVKLTGNELKQTGKAIDAYYNKLAKQNGMTMEEFKKGTSSIAEFDKRVNGAKAYENFEARRRQAEAWARAGHNLSFDQAAIINQRNPNEQYKGWSVFRVDKQGENSYNELVGLIKQQQQQASQMYSNIGQAYRTINRADSRINKGSGGGGGGKTKADVEAVSGSIDEQTKLVQELQKAWRAAADDDSRQKIKAEIEEQQYLLDRMTGKEKFDPTNMRELTDLRGTTAWATSEQLTQGTGLTLPVTLDIQSPEEKLREEVARLQELLTNAFTDAEREALSKALKDKKGQLDNLTGKGGGNKSDVDGFKNFNDKFSQLNSGVGSIVSGIQQMGVEIPKELQSTLSVLQGISTIMTGVLAIMTLMNAKQTAQTAMSFIPFFAHGGLVHAATGYMVPGNDHSDRTLIAASSGELILNRAQQGVIASQLESGNGGGMRVVGEIQGEKIVLVANRFLKRSGQGELVTWK